MGAGHVEQEQVCSHGKSLAGYRQMAITSEVGPAGTLAPTQQPQLYGNLT
jgi:hypothetical protein